MSTFQSRLDAAAGAATCQILNSAGESLVGWSAVSLAFAGTGVVPLALGSAALLASNYACNWDPNAPSTLPTTNNILPGTCMETQGCGLNIMRLGGASQYIPNVQKLVSVEETGTYPTGAVKYTTTYVDCDGLLQTDDEAGADLLPVTTELKPGFTCGGDPYPGDPPYVPDYPYADTGGSNCNINVKFLGMGVEADGTAAPVWQMEPGSTTKAGGGVIGGCNFEPVIYYQPTPPAGGSGGGGAGGDGGKPPTVVPLPPPGPDGQPPDWLDALKAGLAGAAGALAVDAIKELLETPIPGIVWEMPAPCDKDDKGNPLVWTGDIPTQDFNAAVLDRLDALSSQITQHLAWKTPICAPNPPALKGDFRTISFRSDEVSPYGNSRLRKRLRYRSSSGNDLDALIDHWKDFVWQAGAVVVGHVGGPWGSPQVWAASESEAKRVLYHASAEAGFDPDQVGEWKVGVSRGARLGVSGTMRVDTTGGYWWITARDGSNNRPIVGYPSNLQGRGVT